MIKELTPQIRIAHLGRLTSGPRRPDPEMIDITQESATAVFQMHCVEH